MPEIPQKNQSSLSIVFIVDSLVAGGAGRQTSIICNELAQRGHSVTILTTNSTRLGDGYYIASGIDVVPIESLGMINDPLSRIINKVCCITKLRNKFKELDPDLIISFLSSNNFMSIFASTGLNFPLIACERIHIPALMQINASPFNRLFYFLMSKIAYPRASSLCVQTEETSRWLSQEFPRQDIRVIPNIVVPPAGADSVLGLPRQRRQDSKHKSLLFIGRMAKQKRADLLVRAFAKVASIYPNLNLVLVGDGPERGVLEALVADHQLQKRVVFTGHVKDVSVYLDDASIFVLPSSFEGFPNALAEAMSMGVPSICFDILTGTRELSGMGKRAILLPNVDPETELEQSIRALLSDPDKMSALSSEAKGVTAEFEASKITDQWERLARDHSKLRG